MKFGIVDSFVYINSINKSHYEEDKQNWSCITGNDLRSNRGQHLPRWVLIPSTREGARRNSKQELFKQEKGNRIPQRVAESVSVLQPEKVKTWVCKRLGLFLCPTV